MLQHFQQKSLKSGDIIENSQNKFIVIKLLSEGGSGEVYLIQHQKNQALYAMKLQQFIESDEQQICEEFSKHKFHYIVNIIDFFSYQRKVCLVMEYAELGDLRNVISSKRLNYEQVYKILRDCLYGIQELHNLNYIHRDIKPENILLFQDYDNYITYKLCDLGLLKNENLAATMNIGTPYYMAPEQIFENNKTYQITKSSHLLDKKIDIWALGCIWYELITFNTFIDEANSLNTIFDSIKNINQQQIDKKIDELEINQRDKQIMKRFLQIQVNFRFTVQEAIETLNGASKYLEKVIPIKCDTTPIKLIQKPQENQNQIQIRKIQLISSNNVKDIRLNTLEQLIKILQTKIESHQKLIEQSEVIQDLEFIPNSIMEWYQGQLKDIQNKQNCLQKCKFLIINLNKSLLSNEEFQECQKLSNQCIQNYQEEVIQNNKQQYICQMNEQIKNQYKDLKYQDGVQLSNIIQDVISIAKKNALLQFKEKQQEIEEYCNNSQVKKMEEIKKMNFSINQDKLNTLFDIFQTFKRLYQLNQFNKDIDSFCQQFQSELIQTYQYKPKNEKNYEKNKEICQKCITNIYLITKNAQLADQNQKDKIQDVCLNFYQDLIKKLQI